MAINNNPYGALITNGLGYSPSILITGFFSLLIEVQVVIPPVVPPGGAVGGGGTIYVPYPEHLRKKRRLVIFTVTNASGFHWKREYLVDLVKAEYIVKVVNITSRFLNAAESTYKVAVGGIKNLSESVKTSVGNLKTVASSAAESTIKIGNLISKAVKPIVTFIKKDK